VPRLFDNRTRFAGDRFCSRPSTAAHGGMNTRLGRWRVLVSSGTGDCPRLWLAAVAGHAAPVDRPVRDRHGVDKHASIASRVLRRRLLLRGKQASVVRAACSREEQRAEQPLCSAHENNSHQNLSSALAPSTLVTA
jgi:hypothetical protein